MSSDHKRKAMARIHIAKKDLAMDDAEYRAVLAGQTGKQSCGDMTLTELFQVEHYLRDTMGWKPSRQKKNSPRVSPQSAHKKRSEKNSIDKLRALWIDMAKDGLLRDGSENALEQWVIRMSARYNSGRGIQKIEWLAQRPDLCRSLIESLKQWRTRLEAKGDQHGAN